MKTIILLLLILLSCIPASTQKNVSDREHDGFVGPVKKVFVEWTPVSRPQSGIPPGIRCRQMTKVYNEVGRLIQHSVYPGSCGSDEIREDYSFAEDGSRMTKTQEIRGKGSPPPPPPAMIHSTEREVGQPKEVFRYDSSGKKIESSLIRPGGKIAHKTGYSYDTKGRLIEITSYNEGGEAPSRRVYSYDGDERVPSSFTYYGRDGKVYEKTAYTEYEFNSYGDWVKRKEFTEETFNRKSTSLMIRNIEYYDPKK